MGGEREGDGRRGGRERKRGRWFVGLIRGAVVSLQDAASDDEEEELDEYTSTSSTAALNGVDLR